MNSVEGFCGPRVTQGDTGEDVQALVSIAAMGEKMGQVWYPARFLSTSVCRFRGPLLRELLISTSSQNSVHEDIYWNKV